MELCVLLRELHLLPPEKPFASSAPPAVTTVLSQLQEKLTAASSDTETFSLLDHTERLFLTADPDWLFSPAPAGEEELRSTHRSVVRALTDCASLPVCEDESSSLPPAGYHGIPGRALRVCSVLQVLLETLGQSQRTDLLLTLAPSVCVFSVMHYQDQVWTTSSSRAAARRLQEALLRAGGWTDSAHLLMGDRSLAVTEEEGTKRGVLSGVLDLLQPQLTRDTWHRCEAVKLVFVWTLLQVTRPSLSPHLPRFLPPSLFLNDHFRPENCMLGVRCLHHIVINTPAAELRQFNRADVMYEALFKHLFTTEAAVIQLVLSCLLDLMLVFEKPPSMLAPTRRRPCRHDDVLSLVLTHMEAENKVSLRRVYASVLPPYIDRMGVGVCRHLKRLERVVLGYLEIGDPPEETSRLKILEALKTTMTVAWPRMEVRSNLLLRCLLRLLVDVSSDSCLKDASKRKLMSETALCIKLLDRCTHGKLLPVLQQVDSSCCSPEVLSCLASITAPTER